MKQHIKTSVYKPTGRIVNLAKMELWDISRYDISTCLMNTLRFAGGIQWSVAAHSMMCSSIALCNSGPGIPCNYYGGIALAKESMEFKTELAEHMLLHDTHEAYIGDIISPVALVLNIKPQLDALKSSIDKVIYRRFNQSLPDKKMVKYIKQIDALALDAERYYLLKQNGGDDEWVLQFENEIIESGRHPFDNYFSKNMEKYNDEMSMKFDKELTKLWDKNGASLGVSDHVKQ